MAYTYIDSWQKCTRISYWTYSCIDNCITRGMTILQFQFTLYIAGSYSDPDSKEPTTTYIQPEPICQSSGCGLL